MEHYIFHFYLKLTKNIAAAVDMCVFDIHELRLTFQLQCMNSSQSTAAQRPNQPWYTIEFSFYYDTTVFLCFDPHFNLMVQYYQQEVKVLFSVDVKC